MALALNERLEASLARDRQELEIRLVLASAYLASSGWAAPQILQVLGPARDLATRLGEDDKLVAILVFTATHYKQRCEYVSNQTIVDEMYALARSRQDNNALVCALWNDNHTQASMGDFQQARQTMHRLRQVYDPDKHAHFVNTYSMDPKCDAIIWEGYFLWATGYPDQARRAAVEGVELARRLGHAFNLSWSLTGGAAFALCLRGEVAEARLWVREAHALALEHAMTFVAEMLVPWSDGLALIAQGDYEEGELKLADSGRVWTAQGAVHNMPHAYVTRAIAAKALRRFEDAKALLDQAMELGHRTGHRYIEAEAYRVLGELQCEQPNPQIDAAERSFFKALEVARSQDAKGFELRGAMSLARLWKQRGKYGEARELLSPLYSWFIEGFDTKDLKEARAIIDELS